MTDFRKPQSLTILNGTAISSANLSFIELGSAGVSALLIQAPATMPEVVTVYVTTDYSVPASAVFTALQSGGTDVTLTAGKATQITESSAQAVQLVSTGNVAADRVFKVVGARRT